MCHPYTGLMFFVRRGQNKVKAVVQVELGVGSKSSLNFSFTYSKRLRRKNLFIKVSAIEEAAIHIICS